MNYKKIELNQIKTFQLLQLLEISSVRANNLQKYHISEVVQS